MIFIRNIYFVYLDILGDVFIKEEEVICIINEGKVNDIVFLVNMFFKFIFKVKESKFLVFSLGFKRSTIYASKGKKIVIIFTEEDILRIRKRKLLLECIKLRFEVKKLKKDLESLNDE